MFKMFYNITFGRKLRLPMVLLVNQVNPFNLSLRPFLVQPESCFCFIDENKLFASQNHSRTLWTLLWLPSSTSSVMLFMIIMVVFVFSFSYHLLFTWFQLSLISRFVLLQGFLSLLFRGSSSYLPFFYHHHHHFFTLHLANRFFDFQVDSSFFSR